MFLLFLLFPPPCFITKPCSDSYSNNSYLLTSSDSSTPIPSPLLPLSAEPTPSYCSAARRFHNPPPNPAAWGVNRTSCPSAAPPTVALTSVALQFVAAVQAGMCWIFKRRLTWKFVELFSASLRLKRRHIHLYLCLSSSSSLLIVNGPLVCGFRLFRLFFCNHSCCNEILFLCTEVCL